MVCGEVSMSPELDLVVKYLDLRVKERQKLKFSHFVNADQWSYINQMLIEELEDIKNMILRSQKK